MVCEMCGKQLDIATTYTILLEGANLQVCKGCTSYGKIIRKPSFGKPTKTIQKPKKRPAYEPEFEEMIVSDYKNRVKEKREARGLTQKDLANALNEKESLIHSIESGHMEPPLSLARKLSRFLEITLIEEVKVKELGTGMPRSKKVDTMTLGDVITIKKRPKK